MTFPRRGRRSSILELACCAIRMDSLSDGSCTESRINQLSDVFLVRDAGVYAGTTFNFVFGIAAKVSLLMFRCCITNSGGVCVTQSESDRS